MAQWLEHWTSTPHKGLVQGSIPSSGTDIISAVRPESETGETLGKRVVSQGWVTPPCKPSG